MLRLQQCSLIYTIFNKAMLYILKKYLKHLNYTHQTSEIEEYFLSHPNFPSLYAVTDTLEFLNIPNIAAEVQTTDIDKLPNQFITLYQKGNEQEFILIEEVTDSFLYTIDENKKKTKIPRTEFIENWTHIVLLIEKNESQEKNKVQQKGFYPAVFMLGLVMLFVFIKNNAFTGVSLLYLLFSSIGLAISVFILQKEFNIPNQLADQLCGWFNNAKNDCSEVLNSSPSILYKNVKVADLSLVYFFTSLFLVVFLQEHLFYIFISPFLVFAVGYSVYLQVFKLKKQCNLCNVINIVLLATLVLTSQFVTPIHLKNTGYSFLVFTVLYTLFFMLWSTTKPLIEKYFELYTSNIALKKFKRNEEVFHLLVQKNKIPQEGLQKLSGIQIGNPEAQNELLLFLSASCKYCFAVFKEALQLEKHAKGNVKIQIMFNSNIENTTNPYNKVLEIIMANYEVYGNEKAVLLLNEWFVNKLDLQAFINKYQINASPTAKQTLMTQYAWCTNQNYMYSPVKIFNQGLLPKEYTINELKFFC